MSRPCSPARRQRRSRLSPPPLRGAADALHVLGLVAADPPRPETIALLMDASRQGGTCLVVDGTVADEAVVDVAEAVLSSLALHPIDAVVLATVRPTRHGVEDADHWRWFELRDQFDDAGVDLLDWFILGASGPASLAQLTDSRSLW